MRDVGACVCGQIGFLEIDQFAGWPHDYDYHVPAILLGLGFRRCCRSASLRKTDRFSIAKRRRWRRRWRRSRLLCADLSCERNRGADRKRYDQEFTHGAPPIVADVLSVLLPDIPDDQRSA
jgi:hypothetical protein